jgi:lipoprotein NlpD
MINAIKSTAAFITLLFLVLSLSACQSGYQTSKTKPKTNSSQTAKPSQSGMQKTHIVQSGDTLYGISFRAGLNYKDVAVWNGIDEPYTIRVGQKIRLTPPGTQASTANKHTTPVKSSNKTTTQVKPVVVSPAPKIPNQPQVAIESTLVWQWPTKGELIGLYIADDKTNQGINIAGKAGQKIVAAADGIVVYSGAGLIGYGELLIIKHNNEWISAYAHNEKRLVAEGVKVKIGQHIADMGRTGTVSDMLHFEIRRNGKPVDPLLHLPKR